MTRLFMIRPFMSLILGNERDICFWLNPWVGQKMLVNLFLRLYAIMEDKNVKVTVRVALLVHGSHPSHLSCLIRSFTLSSSLVNWMHVL